MPRAPLRPIATAPRTRRARPRCPRPRRSLAHRRPARTRCGHPLLPWAARGQRLPAPSRRRARRSAPPRRSPASCRAAPASPAIEQELTHRRPGGGAGIARFRPAGDRAADRGGFPIYVTGMTPALLMALVAAVAPGQKAPAFSVETTSGKKTLDDYKGQTLVLAFFPKAFTGG